MNASPAYPTTFAPPTATGAPFTAPEPTYKRRCGYWFILVLAVLNGLNLIFVLASGRFDARAISFMLGSVGFIGQAYVLHTFPKLTTETGHFWTIFGINFPVAFLFNLAHAPRIGAAQVLGCLLASAFGSLIAAAVLTMPEDYDGCCACLKCLKPWKVEQVLPAFGAFHSPQYPVQGVPVQYPPTQYPSSPQYPPQFPVQVAPTTQGQKF